ncbi:hypothetical protein CFP65_7117 [Kitasatospora sp. MMS16-BH015]|uniref:DeoR family transcriptional regulator n=1 Tax=Kitasatospora sp. MMS16-BH015 TaxID=2018025 RepID=UPI000CA386BA|nr:DeoR family transcriptional regulator [Kitasatospora sp. MMS16-BH015]AUG81718.1 hypothetical protein CFP65_7117 [Kitasatospora sp. MMS16-BH015]
MFQTERWPCLLGLVQERGRVRVGEAARLMGVSPVTVRRDLDHLAQEGRLVRVRGGAVPVRLGAGRLPQWPAAQVTGGVAGERSRLAAAAAGLVPSGAVVGLAGGVVGAETARLLAARPFLSTWAGYGVLSVVTSAPSIARQLAGQSHIRSVVLGGGEGEETVPGEEVLRGVRLDYAVVEYPEPSGAALALATRADRVLALVPAARLTAALAERLGAAGRRTTVVTGAPPVLGLRHRLRGDGIRVHVA